MTINRIIILLMAFSLAACDSTHTEKDNPATTESAVEATSTATEAQDTATDMEKIAYALGANNGLFLAKNLPEFESWGMPLDAEVIKKGFLDSIENKSTMDEQQIQAVLMAFQEQIQAKLEEINEQQAKATAEANQIFLEQNAAKEGVKVTQSGLQYRIIKEGTGVTPSTDDRVEAHYRGTLVNGQEFDSSYARNKPEQFALNSVIPGWSEGLQLLKEGGKIELVLPPEMAYGDRDLGQIPPNSILIFEVELLKVMEADSPETATGK